MNYSEAIKKLEGYGQRHILQYFEELSGAEQKSLLEQIELTDFSVISEGKEFDAGKRGEISPLKAIKIEEIAEKKETFREIGTKALREGKVAMVLLAGGMGTRLGSDDPKGMFNIGETKDVYIFQRLVENLLEVVNLVEKDLYFFIMTSDKNHKKTVDFFKEHRYFGYNPEYVKFFMQEMAPATDYEGKVYMESKSTMSISPNGNGGWFSSMKKWGILDIVHRENIEYLNVFTVDNVLQKMADPCFIGATIAHQVEVGSKVVRKVSADEKVGVMCQEDGRPSVIEYFEMSEELKNMTDESGERVYNYGVILNYLFSVKAVEKVMDNKLPVHIVEKKIAYMDENEKMIKPEETNGYKYEILILDMIHMLNNCLPYEVEREKEFAPIKNRVGVDSVDTAKELLRKNGYTL